MRCHMLSLSNESGMPRFTGSSSGRPSGGPLTSRGSNVTRSRCRMNAPKSAPPFSLRGSLKERMSASSIPGRWLMRTSTSMRSSQKTLGWVSTASGCRSLSFAMKRALRTMPAAADS